MASPRRGAGAGQGGTLPPLRSSYQESFVYNRGNTPPQGAATPVNGDRVSVLEGRLAMQEKTTQSLLDRAYKDDYRGYREQPAVKEDIIDSLNFTHGTWKDEKHSREMLQEHIKTITEVVKKLNKDIEGLEAQIRTRSGDVQAASNAVKTLEMHHVAGITDLRGRVARADGAISKLATDLKQHSDSLRQQEKKLADTERRLQERLQHVGIRIEESNTRLEKESAGHQMQLRQVEGESNANFSQIDAKTKLLFEDVKAGIQTTKALADTEREKLENRVVTAMDRAIMGLEAKLDKVEKHVDDQNAAVMRRMERLEQEVITTRDKTANLQHTLEGRLQHMLQENLRRQAQDVERLKRKYEDSFVAVQESITSVKDVLEGKQKLLSEQLRKEINQIRKMVVLI